jgi:hypothetical protein
MKFLPIKPRHTYLNIFYLIVFTLLSTITQIDAQAKLSIQGIIKRSTGSALEDGTYPIKFNIYAKDNTPLGILWTETIDQVDVNGGVYSEVLGNVNTLNLPFDQDYELAVEINGKEMSPKIELTSAPYALSLRGQSNQFPSTGLVLADNLRVAQGVLARAGTPGLSGANNNGYGMIGNNDTGLFSTAYGKVSLFVNNVEKLEVTPTTINLNNPTNVQGTLGANNVNLYNNGGINYSTTDGGSYAGWRLADVDDHDTGPDGWQVYDEVSGQYWGWQNPNAAGAPCTCNYSANSSFMVNVLQPNNNNQVLKKLFSPSGSYSHIKVKFRFYFIDGWDNDTDLAWAGFANAASGSGLNIAWKERSQFLSWWGEFNNASLNFTGQPNVPDSYIDVEMTAKRSSPFWVFVGAHLNESTADEHFAISNVEVWVR